MVTKDDRARSDERFVPLPFREPAGTRRRETPPEVTHAECFYYVKQIESRVPLVFKLRDGEEIRGVLGWYDRAGLRIDRPDGTHLVLQKSAVAYLYKEGDLGA